MKKIILMAVIFLAAHTGWAQYATNTPTPTLTPINTPVPPATPTPVNIISNVQSVAVSADVLAPVTINFNKNVKTYDIFSNYAVPPTGTAPVTNMIYDEYYGEAVTTNNAVTQTIPHAVLNGEQLINNVACRSILVVPQITPTQTCVATYVISVDKTN